MSFKLRSVTITSYSLALAELGVGRAQEVVSLGYRTLEAEYVVRNPRNGDSQGTVRGSYDIALNEVRGI